MKAARFLGVSPGRLFEGDDKIVNLHRRGYEQDPIRMKAFEQLQAIFDTKNEVMIDFIVSNLDKLSNFSLK